MKKNNRKGFTLGELLIVVAIIGILVAISIPIFSAQLKKAKNASNLSNARSMYAQLAVDYMDDGVINSAPVGTYDGSGDAIIEVGGMKYKFSAVPGASLEYSPTKNGSTSFPMVRYKRNDTDFSTFGEYEYTDEDFDSNSSNDSEYSEGENSDNENSDAEYSDNEYSDYNYSDDEYSGNEYSDNEYSGNEYSDNEYYNDYYNDNDDYYDDYNSGNEYSFYTYSGNESDEELYRDSYGNLYILSNGEYIDYNTYRSTNYYDDYYSSNDYYSDNEYSNDEYSNDEYSGNEYWW